LICSVLKENSQQHTAAVAARMLATPKRFLTRQGSPRDASLWRDKHGDGQADAAIGADRALLH
jgi:hypothetical protein